MKTGKGKEHMVLLREKQQEIEVQEQSRLALAEAIKSAVAKFPVEEGHEDEDAVAKVGQVSRIAVDLRRQVDELKAQQQQRTPPEAIEEYRKTTSEAIDRIKEGEKICKKVIEAILTTWELLLEDETTPKFIEGARQAELKNSHG